MLTIRPASQQRLLISDSLSETIAFARTIPGLNGRLDGRDSWAGETFENCARKCATGDLSLVESSNEFLSQLESSVAFPRPAFQIEDSVTGGVPNVGAYLAGNPLNMRRRRRMASEFAPLTIVLDLTSSASLNSATLMKRGTVALALLRLLSATRPVTIYAGTCTGGNDRDAATVSGIMTRLDSAPLDLARAAHVCGSVAFSRRICYGIANNSGPWPWGNIDTYRNRAVELWAHAFGGEILFIPPIFHTDQMLANPAHWLITMLAKYGNTLPD